VNWNRAWAINGAQTTHLGTEFTFDQPSATLNVVFGIAAGESSALDTLLNGVISSYVGSDRRSALVKLDMNTHSLAAAINVGGLLALSLLEKVSDDGHIIMEMDDLDFLYSKYYVSL
jgi:hypothetical protein